MMNVLWLTAILTPDYSMYTFLCNRTQYGHSYSVLFLNILNLTSRHGMRMQIGYYLPVFCFQIISCDDRVCGPKSQ